MDFIFIWLVTLILGYWTFKKIKSYQGLPPGPWGLPVIGYLPFINRHQPHLTLMELSKKYGPICSLSMGSIFTVVLSDHKLIREAFSKDHFSGRAPLYLTHGIMHGKGLICAEGGLWKDQRKLITTWLKNFGMSKHSASRKDLESRIASGVQELLGNVDQHENNPMDLSQMLTHSLGNVVNEIIFGYKYPPGDKTWQWFRQIQEEGAHEMGVAGAVNFLPFIRHFSSSVQRTILILTRGIAQTHRLYASIIDRRRKLLNLNVPKGAIYEAHENLLNEHPKGHIKCISYTKHESNMKEHYFDPQILLPGEGECILDNFLEEQNKRFKNDDDSAQYMNDDQLHFLLADMFGAGLDTTAVTISWFFLFMAIHQEEQDIVREEILSASQLNEELDYSQLPKLMAAVCETQRIRSIVPVGIPHGCIEETYLGGYRIPKNAMVMPLQWAVHMDPHIWTDPNQFRPSRFIASDGSLLKPQEFIPFQTGKRMCPGDELARMVIAGVVAKLLAVKRFKLASPVPSQNEMMGHVGITLTPPKVEFFCESLNK